jgi:alkylation response protein AidB-like acyl-CoA dehydrogenase
MDLEPTQDQVDLVGLVRSALASKQPWHDALGAGPAAADDPVWHRLTELGVFGLALPEADGGAGLGLPEEALVFEQLGANLTRGPVLATTLACHVARTAGRAEVLQDALAGSRVALLQPYGAITAAADGGSVTGELAVIDGVAAELGLVVTPAAAFLLPLGALTARRPVAATDRLSTVELAHADDVRPVAVIPGGDTWDRGGLLTAAQLAGIARRTLELSVSHAKTRHQFGSPIGAFQAVKHRCADMAVRATAAEAQVRLAALTVAGGLPGAAEEAHAAKVVAASAAEANAAANILNHGGMGFTAELGAHLFVRRAAALGVVFGSAAAHRRALVDAVV